MDFFNYTFAIYEEFRARTARVSTNAEFYCMLFPYFFHFTVISLVDFVVDIIDNSIAVRCYEQSQTNKDSISAIDLTTSTPLQDICWIFRSFFW
jgi:hypothetical protein